MANPILRIKRGSSTPASLSSGELAMDLTNLSLFVGQADGTPLAIGGSGTFATKAYTDSAVAAETSARESAVTEVTELINQESIRAQNSEVSLSNDISEEAYQREQGILAARLVLEAADLALDGRVTSVEGDVSAILSASDADKNSFAEIVTLINSVDTTNDQAFAGYVISNNSALATEATNRTNADTALGGRIDGVVSAATALALRVTTAESDINAEESARTSAVSAEQAARIAADNTLTSNLSSEGSRAIAAEGVIAANLATETNNRISADSALNSRVTAIETTIDGGTY